MAANTDDEDADDDGEEMAETEIETFPLEYEEGDLPPRFIIVVVVVVVVIDAEGGERGNEFW